MLNVKQAYFRQRVYKSFAANKFPTEV